MRHLWVTAALTASIVLGAGVVRASSVLGLSIEDQTRLSKWVLIGKVTVQQGLLHPQNGLETAVSLSVIDVLKGDVRPGDVVRFHTRGGEIGAERSEAIGEARLQTGKPILVFIEEIDGRKYNLGLSLGVWDVHEGAAGQTMLTRAVEDGLNIVGDVDVEYGPLSLTDFSRRIDTAIREPQVDHPFLRQMSPGGR